MNEPQKIRAVTQSENRRIDRKPLLAEINSFSAEIAGYGNFKDRFADHLIKRIPVEQWFCLYEKNRDLVTIDARSEKEFDLDHLPGAINFPILNDRERDEVGFLYKQVSTAAAYFWAEKIADQKIDQMKKLVADLQGREVVVHCWRGGGRSTALANYLNKLGLPCSKISGGYKSYRQFVHHTFYESGAESLNFVVLTGLTGCGKTQIIERLAGLVPTLDIEAAASHASSLFGQLRYNHLPVVASQTRFESRLFGQLLQRSQLADLPYLTEGESKSVSTFQIPDTLYKRLKESPAIKINASLESRVTRIEQEYFGGEKSTKVAEIINSSRFFKMLIGGAEISRLSRLLENGQTSEFCEWFLTEYYDKRYSGIYSNIVTSIDNEDLDAAAEQVRDIMAKQTADGKAYLY